MTLDAAIDIIARHVIAAGAERFVLAGWEHYPEIGEQDWDRVNERVSELAPFPHTTEVTAAYKILEARAETVE